VQFDIVIPVYNEAPSLVELADEIGAVCQAGGLDVHLVFVDDGSTDGSWQAIRECQRRHGAMRVQGVRLDSNCGKSTALAVGFLFCNCDLVFTMDADLQDDPAEIPTLLAAMRSDVDLVCGWKRRRQDPFPRRVLSWGFKSLVNAVMRMDLHDHNCGFKLLRKEILPTLDMRRGRHRLITAMAASAGFDVIEVPVHHRKRKFGHSKYGAGRIFRGFWQLTQLALETRFARRPVKISLDGDWIREQIAETI